SLAGAALLLLSQGLGRRLNTAYYLTASILAIGIVSSLLKGGDFEEAAFLAGLDRCGGRRHRGLRLAWTVRVQACRVLARSVVAVRAGLRGAEVPASIGWRGNPAVVCGGRAACRPCAARNTRTDRRGASGRRRHHLDR